MDAQARRIAFIGTGVMGGSMASRLVAAGHDVTVYTRTRVRAESLLASTPPQLNTLAI